MRITALAMAALCAAACGRADTEKNVRNALEQANVQSVDVAADDDAGVVHLRGTVQSMAERTRAEEVAAAVVGTSGRVLNELTIKGLNDRTAGDLDDEVLDALDAAVDRDPTLKDRDITFEVVNGAVTVKGEVRSVGEKNHVTDIVKAAPGVKDMANALQIRSEP